MVSTSTVESNGIFHGLPTFPEHDGKTYSAIVTGANGISGDHMVKVLAQSPQRWKHIYALSRRPPLNHLSNADGVQHIAVDFLASEPSEIARILKENGVQADFVFFASYVQTPPKKGEGLWSDTDEMTRQNTLLLSNFLSALKIAFITPSRIILQTGAKHYGVHLGPTLTPEEEDDPRVLIAPNFYFQQEDLLGDYSRETGSHWNVTRPGFIIGAVKDAAMNITYPLAVYAAIQKYLGQSLDFPGDISAWETESHQSTATLIAYHAEWAALTPAAADQALNISDSSQFTWGKFWPILAKWYGISYTSPNPDTKAYNLLEMPLEPPPRGFGPRGKIYASFSFASWAQEPEVLTAWDALRKKYGLVQSPFDDTLKTFGLIDGEILTPWPRSISMDKSRKLGWHGYVDTKDAIFETITKLAELKMVPPMEGVESCSNEDS
ncbi:hypothetical protein MMC17_005624 [Xylographa soralifera]|nr:hypothetical protein [Xylographa soralifera]